jgi:hypothetical protein
MPAPAIPPGTVPAPPTQLAPAIVPALPPALNTPAGPAVRESSFDPAALISQSRGTNAFQALVQQLLDANRGHDQRYYVVVIPEDAMPRIDAYDSLQELITALIPMLGTPVSLFPFMGYRLGITRGPQRYLQTPFGPFPLFRTPAPGEADLVPDGWVGAEPQLTVPQAPVEPTGDELPADAAEPADGLPEDETPVIADASG